MTQRIVRIILNKTSFFLLLAYLITILGGCATVYQSEGLFVNGYSNRRLSENVFEVTFRANEHTPEEKVLEYALRRSRGLAQEAGYSYFTVLKIIRHAPGLYYPSVRLIVECAHEPLDGRDWVSVGSSLHRFEEA